MAKVPLPASFMLIGILGFIFSVLYWGKIGASWGFTFALFSVILFAASMLSLRESVEVKPKMAVRGKKRSRRKKR